MSETACAAGMTPAAGRWPMAIRGFFCQNVAIGCAFGGFGLTVLPTQAEFGVSRGLATLGLPLTVLVMGLVTPLVSAMIARIGLRWTMLLGILLSGTGYGVLAMAPGISVVLLAYALLIGTGTGMFGAFASSVLAGNWFQANPGPAIGFVNVPLFIALLPMLALAVIPPYGMAVYFLCMTGLHVLLLPLAWGIRGAPDGVPAAEAGHEGGPQAAFVVPTGVLLRRPLFWVMVFGVGVLNAVGMVGVSNIPAFAIERGVPPALAATLLSIYGVAAIGGALLAGILCDRIGAARTLALLSAALGLSWMALLAAHDYALMVPAAMVIGIAASGVTPSLGVMSGLLYGPPSLARVMGLAMMTTLPFTFCLPPIAGVAHDVAGGYGPVVAGIVILCAAVALLFYATDRVAGRRERISAVMPTTA